jgi:hypothetical protein
MGFADNLRNELKNQTEDYIATHFEPRKEEIFRIISSGIKRIGYVRVDVFNNTGTAEGKMLGIRSGTEINAFAEFLDKEGFRTRKAWWGYSSDGDPDMLTITV